MKLDGSMRAKLTVSISRLASLAAATAIVGGLPGCVGMWAIISLPGVLTLEDKPLPFGRLNLSLWALIVTGSSFGKRSISRSRSYADVMLFIGPLVDSFARAQVEIAEILCRLPVASQACLATGSHVQFRISQDSLEITEPKLCRPTLR